MGFPRLSLSDLAKLSRVRSLESTIKAGRLNKRRKRHTPCNTCHSDATVVVRHGREVNVPLAGPAQGRLTCRPLGDMQASPRPASTSSLLDNLPKTQDTSRDTQSFIPAAKVEEVKECKGF